MGLLADVTSGLLGNETPEEKKKREAQALLTPASVEGALPDLETPSPVTPGSTLDLTPDIMGVSDVAPEVPQVIKNIGASFVEGATGTAAEMAATPEHYIENIAGKDNWYAENFIDPAKRYAEETKANVKADGFAEELVNRLAKGAGSMAVQLPIDAAIGAAILAALPETVAVGAVSGVSYAAIKILQGMKPFAVGMFARQTAKEAGTGDLWRTMTTGVESAVFGKTMSIIPEGKAGQKLIPIDAIKNAVGWGAFNTASQGLSQIKEVDAALWEGRDVKWVPAKEWLLGFGEGVGFSSVFIGTRLMHETAASAHERAYTEAIKNLASEGRYRPDLVQNLIDHPATSDQVKQAAREVQGAFHEEMKNTAYPENRVVDPVLPEKAREQLATPEGKSLLPDDTALRTQINHELDKALAEGKIDPKQHEANVIPEPPVNNASGESAASVEALNRVASEKRLGQDRVMVDARTGKETPLIGVDAVDLTAKPNSIMIETGKGKNGAPLVTKGKNVTDAQAQKYVDQFLKNRTPKLEPPKVPETQQEQATDIAAHLAAGEVKLAEATAKERWVPEAQDTYAIGDRVMARDLAGGDNWGNIQAADQNPSTLQWRYKIGFRNPDTGHITIADKWYNHQEIKGILRDRARQAGADLNQPTLGLMNHEQVLRTAEALLKVDKGELPLQPEMINSLNPNNMNTTAESIMMLKAFSEALPDVIKTDVETHETTVEGAWQTPTSVAWMRDKFQGTRHLAQTVTAARMTLLYSTAKLATLKARFLESQDPQDQKLFTEWVEVHGSLQYMTNGMISEIGRALGSLNIKVMGDNIMRSGTLEELSRAIAKQGKGNYFMAAWVELFKGWMFGNPGTHGVNLTMNLGFSGIQSIENYLTVGYGKMLGSRDRMTLKQANANATGKLYAHALAGRYLIDMFTKAGEIGAEVARKTGSKVDGARAFEDALNTLSLQPFSNKYGGDTKSFTHRSMFGDLDPNSTTFDTILAKTTDTIGMTSRASLAMLGVEDIGGRYISYMGKIHEISVREAERNGFTGESYENYVKGFVRAHTMVLEQNLRPRTKGDQVQVEKYVGDGAFHKEAMESAAESIFAGDFEGGSPGQNLLSQFQKTVSQVPSLQFLFPTTKTPMNILAEIIQRTPLMHKFSKEMTDDINAGGVRRDRAYAKLTMGFTLYSIGLLLYWSGNILPNTEKDMKGALRAVGGKADSLIVAGKSYALGQMSPIGNFLSIAARLGYMAHNVIGVDEELGTVNLFDQAYPVSDNTMSAIKNAPILGTRIGAGGQHWKMDTAISYTMIAFSSMMADQVFLGQLKSLMDAVWGDRGVKGAQKFMQRTIVGATVPFAGQWRFKNSTDPFLRETEDMLDAWKVATNPQGAPIYEGLPVLGALATPVRPKYDMFGKPVPNEGKALWMVPQSTLNPSDSPIRKELMRLELPIQEMIDNEYKGVELTKEQQERWHQIVAELGMEEYLNEKTLRSNRYQKAKDSPGSTGYNTKGALIKDVVSAFRRKAIGILNREEDRQIGKDVKTKKKGIPDDAHTPTIGGWDSLVTKFGKGEVPTQSAPAKPIGGGWDLLVDKYQKNSNE